MTLKNHVNFSEDRLHFQNIRNFLTKHSNDRIFRQFINRSAGEQTCFLKSHPSTKLYEEGFKGSNLFPQAIGNDLNENISYHIDKFLQWYWMTDLPMGYLHSIGQTLRGSRQ